MTIKYVVTGALVATLLIPGITSAFAGGAREDWSDKYTDIPGAPECWVDGYDDGQDNPFDQDRHRDCIFNNVEKSESDLCCNCKPYYEGFMYGCMSVEGNTQEDCERNIE